MKHREAGPPSGSPILQTSERPLRIAHVVNAPLGFESASGVQQVIHCLSRAQAELGQAVAVFSRDDNAVNVLGAGAEPTPGTPRKVSGRSGSLLREWFLSRYLERRLAEDVLAWQPDIVHFHSVHIPQNVALATVLRRTGIPYCVTVHGGLFPPALQRSRLKKSLFDVLFERRYLNEAAFIHALSPDEAEAIRRRLVNRLIIIVPNGLPPESTLRGSRPKALFAENPWLRDRRVFMFIGRLDLWQKGLDLLVEAFAQARVQNAALVLVGPDWRGSRATLAALADRLGISSQLVFTGPAYGEDRANLLAAADVFVHPSRWEGLSLSVLTAAAAGKPCLITREADPLGELERAGGAITAEASVASIASALKRAAISSREELGNMGERARTVAQAHLTWPSITERLLATYRTAISPTDGER